MLINVLSPVEGIGSYVFIALGKSKRFKFNATKIILHPDYDYKTHKADIALMKFTPSAITIISKY